MWMYEKLKKAKGLIRWERVHDTGWICYGKSKAKMVYRRCEESTFF